MPTERPHDPSTTFPETPSFPSRTTLAEDMPHVPLRTALPEEGTALRRPTQRDWELQVLMTIEVTQRFRELADDAYPINQPLSAEGQAERTHILGVYRTHAFVEDLAIGEFDQDPTLLRNQEYDSYYTDLRHYVSTSSPTAALALGMRTPQPPPSIALTIPPIYEPSDLPAYTATKLPPPYSLKTFHRMILDDRRDHSLLNTLSFMRMLLLTSGSSLIHESDTSVLPIRRWLSIILLVVYPLFPNPIMSPLVLLPLLHALMCILAGTRNPVSRLNKAVPVMNALPFGSLQTWHQREMSQRSTCGITILLRLKT
ncbi:MAG: hypothetical protein LQ348_006540 [Seirophora lacunosa]|nr:MAG: hypothetical protein LQ344_006256 [Seirophora lacunosa]KAI4173576.1 MAG: hypothetical protein LQ348_006540 [Seirophora lacunosa]